MCSSGGSDVIGGGSSRLSEVSIQCVPLDIFSWVTPGALDRLACSTQTSSCPASWSWHMPKASVFTCGKCAGAACARSAGAWARGQHTASGPDDMPHAWHARPQAVVLRPATSLTMLGWSSEVDSRASMRGVLLLAPDPLEAFEYTLVPPTGEMSADVAPEMTGVTSLELFMGLHTTGGAARHGEQLSIFIHKSF